MRKQPWFPMSSQVCHHTCKNKALQSDVTEKSLLSQLRHTSGNNLRNK